MTLLDYESLGFRDMKETAKSIPMSELKILVNQINKGGCKKKDYRSNCLNCISILAELSDRKMFYFPCPHCPDRAKAETLFRDDLIVKNGDVACVSCWKKLDADSFEKRYHCVEVLYQALFEDSEDFWKGITI